MAVIEVNWRPGRRQLRQFAVVGLAGFAGLGLLFAWRLGALSGAGPWTVPVALWAVGAAVGLLGLLAPPAVRPIYVAMMAVALPIGWVVTHLVLALLYYGLLTPIGLLVRLTGRDPMHRRLDREASSYWIQRPAEVPVSRYFRQF